MALNKLKKWIGTQLFASFLEEYNQNVDATNAVIDLAETNAANISSLISGNLVYSASWTSGVNFVNRGIFLIDDRFLFIHLQVTGGVSTNGLLLGTLPANLRPTGTRYVPGFWSADTGQLLISSAGEMTGYGTSGNMRYAGLIPLGL